MSLTSQAIELQVESARAELAELTADAEALERGLATSPWLEAALDPAPAQLGAVQRAADVAFVRLELARREDRDEALDAWEHAARRLRRTIDALRADVEAETAAEPLDGPTTQAQLEAWQRQVDEALLQAHLARMDARDDLDHMLESLRSARWALRRAATHPVGEARQVAAGALRDLRRSWSDFQRRLHRPD